MAARAENQYGDEGLRSMYAQALADTTGANGRLPNLARFVREEHMDAATYAERLVKIGLGFSHSERTATRLAATARRLYEQRTVVAV